MRPLLLLFVPLGLLIATIVLIVKGLVLIGVAVAVLVVPFLVADLLLHRARAARDSAGFNRAIRQMQAGTHVPEWQRRV